MTGYPTARARSSASVAPPAAAEAPSSHAASFCGHWACRYTGHIHGDQHVYAATYGKMTGSLLAPGTAQEITPELIKVRGYLCADGNDRLRIPNFGSVTALG